MINVLQRIGASAGTAVTAVILQREEITRHAASPATAALAGAFGVTFWWATAFTVLPLGPALLLPSRPAGRPGSPGAARQPAARNPPS